MAAPQAPLEVAKENLPDTLPVLPLYDAVLFPKMVIPLVVLQGESIKLVDEAMTKDRIVGLLVSKASADKKPEPKPAEESDQQLPTPPPAVTVETDKTDPENDLYQIGTIALILKLAKTEENRAQLLVQGMNRFRVKGFMDGKTYLQAKVEYLEDIEEKDKETTALVTNLLGLFSKVVELSPALPQEVGAMAKTIQEPGILANVIASTINTSVAEKQHVLELDDVKQRLKEVTRLVNYQLEILELGHKIQSQVEGDMEKRQREYYLRQQLEAIKEELGEKDDSAVELEEYRAKIKEKNLPEEAHKEAERELNRLSRMHPSSAEYSVALTYLDWITSLPWHESTEDNLDIKKARKILDEDHYGLDKAKRRIIEFLAVRKLKPDSKGPILCFAGPPGTGKTSLGQSIARALGRKFVRISLGGVRDEAEIRGAPTNVCRGIAGSHHPGPAAGRSEKSGIYAG